MTASRTRKSAEERKTEIVDAAIRLAAEIGPDRLTTERLAQEVGISQPGIFRHFPTKADIWTGVAQRIATLFQANAAPGDSNEASPQDRLRRMVGDHLHFIHTTPAIPAILFSRELHAENDDLRAFFAGMMVKRQRKFSEQIKAGVTLGTFDPHLDADDAAALILTLIQGLAMRWSLNARSFNLIEEGKRLLELQLAGFKNRAPGQL
ncbi:MAG: TetR/AcrR family transcriptional regulator [Rhodobacteraceae bacterium]|nr:TetR/AcrR family transcriptional regulator [Paracoccaceae bacterium]